MLHTGITSQDLHQCLYSRDSGAHIVYLSNIYISKMFFSLRKKGEEEDEFSTV